jgi:hypothetical protein
VGNIRSSRDIRSDRLDQCSSVLFPLRQPILFHATVECSSHTSEALVLNHTSSILPVMSRERNRAEEGKITVSLFYLEAKNILPEERIEHLLKSAILFHRSVFLGKFYF